MAKNDENSREIYSRAVKHAQAGERTAAIALFESLIGGEAPQVQVLSALVRLHLDNQSFVKAADHMMLLARLVSAPAQLLADAADIYSRAEAFDKAAQAFDALHTAMPGYATGYFNHAYMLRAAHRFEEALAMYDKALLHHIEGAEEVWLNKAVIHGDHLRDDKAAADCLQKALDLNASYLPALLNRANLYEETSDRAKAREIYERVVEIAPENPVAVARLLNLSRASELDDVLVRRAEKLAVAPHVKPRERSGLLFALGKGSDVRGDYEKAFSHYTAANKTAKALGPAYDRRATEQFFTDIRDLFSADWFRHTENVSDTTPTFICGMFRSGSTLTEQVIAAHPDATPGGELEYFVALANRALAPFPAAVREKTQEEFRRMATQYLELLEDRFPGAGLVTDKRPDNFLYIGLIKTLFPNARFVHTTRNALDNCLSVHFLELADSMAYAKDLMDTAHYYVQQTRLMEHWKRLFPNDVFTMHYDDFVVRPREQAEALLAFLGLLWHEDCLQFHKLTNTVKTVSYWQVREPLYTESSGRHRHYAGHLDAVREYLRAEGVL
jgi:tetratricopeptide (TPR) repeat protein